METPPNGAGAVQDRPQDIIRAVGPRVALRAEGDDTGDGNTLFGHFARFDEWTEIDSYFEGRFLERIAPGAFKKTFREQADQIRVLFQHGRDADIGDKPIAEPKVMREEDEGAYYEARLFDGLPPLLLEGLRAGQYGASFKMRVMREEIIEEPKASDHNPARLPERTIKEIRLYEFGPVTFPAYENATAGVRSLTDEFVFDWIAREPSRARELIGAIDLSQVAARATSSTQDTAPSKPDAAREGTSVPERRDIPTPGRYGLSTQDDARPAWAL
jgi:HK97 family phage prohead protease